MYFDLRCLYVFRPVFRPSPGMSIQKFHERRYNKIEIKWTLVYSQYFLIIKWTDRIVNGEVSKGRGKKD
jgi:hypothetical protein